MPHEPPCGLSPPPPQILAGSAKRRVTGAAEAGMVSVEGDPREGKLREGRGGCLWLPRL